MQQLLQSLKTGCVELGNLPCPQIRKGHLLIRTENTLVSTGTERMLLNFGKSNWVQKARQQPDKVRMVVDKIKTDGFLPTMNTVLSKLDQQLAMGYCNVGTVMAVGSNVTEFSVGDRVISNGNHAEVVLVPENLCAKIPDHIENKEAVFTVLGSIALQGVRLIQPTLGECVVVSGLGLIGLLTVQILRANGCHVLGIDFDQQKLALASQFGAETVNLASGEDPIQAAQRFSKNRGVDAVLITASTASSEPVKQAAQMSRKRGRIVLVGVTGLELSRADFYEKELSFQVSCSYGPGRYDPNYEKKGLDYPIGFVRWTEQRNFEAVLDLMKEGKLDVKPLISHRFLLEEATQAYELVMSKNPSLGILLEYNTSKSDEVLKAQTVDLPFTQHQTSVSLPHRAPTIGFIGSGNYANVVLIPAFKSTKSKLKTIASYTGMSGFFSGRKFGFEKATTDVDFVLNDSSIDAVVIATRHDSHADLVLKSLSAGKHVFVEKPLALTLEELAQIEKAYHLAKEQNPHVVLTVGFNRRFAPHTQKIKSLLSGIKEPKAFVMTVNAGFIPSNHWTQDKSEGGGRLIGEACHFIDLLRYLADAKIMECQQTSLTTDTVALNLRFQDNSIGTIHYLSNGHRSFPKERLEVFAGNRVLQLDNFKRLRGFGWPNFTKLNLWNQDKGQTSCALAFVNAVKNHSNTPIPIDELIEVSTKIIELVN